MLEAQRDQLLANVKQGALGLRMTELDALAQRFVSLIGVTSLAAGFAFSAMVEIELPDRRDDGTYATHVHITIYAFYFSAAISFSLAVYVVAISTFAVAASYRLALLGGQNQSLDRAVAVLLIEFRTVVTAAAAGVIALIVSAASIAWVKMQEAGMSLPLCFIYLLNLIAIVLGLRRVRDRLQIEKGALVHGDATLRGAAGDRINLAEVEIPGSPAKLEERATAALAANDSTARNSQQA